MVPGGGRGGPAEPSPQGEPERKIVSGATHALRDVCPDPRGLEVCYYCVWRTEPFSGGDDT